MFPLPFLVMQLEKAFPQTLLLSMEKGFTGK